MAIKPIDVVRSCVEPQDVQHIMDALWKAGFLIVHENICPYKSQDEADLFLESFEKAGGLAMVPRRFIRASKRYEG